MKLSNLDFIKATEKRQAKMPLKCLSTRMATDSSIAEKVKQPLKDISTRRAIVSSIEKEANLTERYEHIVLNSFEPFDIAKERAIGNNDLMSINYLQLGFFASRAVCRIHVKNINGGNEGYGTGFLITPNLLLTNNHIFESGDFAVKSFAEFNYQYNMRGEPSESYLFEFIPSEFFYTNKDLDYTIVAIKPTSKSKEKSISDFGYLKLFQEPNKALISEYVSIVQHANGGYKQIAIRENQVTGKDDNFITYVTDTAQGSSGSPVFNDQWQVVALHHSGVPRKDEYGNYLCKDGSIFQRGMDDSRIDWVSNEGVRISAIIKDIKQSKNVNGYVKEIFTLPPFQLEKLRFERTTKKETENMNNNVKTSVMNNKITFTIPIEISVGIGENLQLSTINVPTSETSDIQQTEPSGVEKATNQDYPGRNGYDAEFVKTDDFKIEIEKILEKQENVLAPILYPTTDNNYFLHYFNFSVAIHKHRKLCIITAVNIDGEQLGSIKRENTKWILDPRMDEKFQTGPTVYAKNDLDRGHMVRRLDPVWGENAEAANDDTFHFTNSTPQHKNLNQKDWLKLEDYILKSTGDERAKVSVFTGPVFSEDDIPYRGVLLPLQFWKVAALIKADGKPSVTGYMLKQPDNIEDFRTMEGIREDGFGQFKTYQVPLQQIANLTGITFNKFNEFDPLEGIDFNETSKLIEITGEQDIKL